MIKRHLRGLIAAILMTLIAGCNTHADQCETIDNDNAQAVIVDYFKAISEKDFDALHSMSTQDYMLFEDGVIWNNDSLIAAIKSMPSARIEYEFKDFRFEADCNGAFVHYLNHGTFTLGDTAQMDMNWIESAYIKKVDGELKLNFLHSTRAE